ncbi:MAG: SEC-C metal-binding domain-containing protein [Eubacteriales bacterium]|nr:SEC-C metal-binding domain-containing protein [Eubacteriales bacterium]MDD4389198.1 SEC-C metal-binding domain-containing protein [Eubacteriales bacterium]
MSLYKNWLKLAENQTDDTFEKFWDIYSSTETKIYRDIISKQNPHVEGTFDDLVKKYDVDPLIFMGWLDGIQTSIENSMDLDTITNDSKLEMDIIWEALFYNMIDAEADYLFCIEEWDSILSEEKQQEIADDWRRSRTVVKEKLPGRNDPCPCGSGKKYKKCCGAN